MKVRSESLVKAYKGRRVVDGVSVTLEEGRVVGLLGPNGAGKTTTFYMVTGLIKPNQGRVFLDDRDVTSLPMFRRARIGIGYLAQESSVFRRLSVEDNLKLVMEQRGVRPEERRRRVNKLSEDLHISHLLGQPGGVLSGGERRRVEIARALATEPRFILLDEPFTGIDPVTIEELQGIIRRLAANGIGILITDHNVDATLSITDHNYILIQGKITAEGDEAQIRANDHVRKYYLGHGFGVDGRRGEEPDGDPEERADQD
ncbi:MAG: LPS export ABC transporter ATP-binding protein [Fimbriimonadaceae bacterium]|nr:LPS export ABC transporter ATP-binding protein [Fimbriimonadaceae bacterium]QYK56235.1 MAG: LPS export ABC transporter ATP-binding protein [Fimbriimonadaceae bacterium]